MMMPTLSAPTVLVLAPVMLALPPATLTRAALSINTPRSVPPVPRPVPEMVTVPVPWLATSVPPAVPLPFKYTPMLLIPDVLPPRPETSTVPAPVAITFEPLRIATPKLLEKPPADEPSPLMVILPAPPSNCALSRSTPTSAPTAPIAAVVPGTAPPPSVIKPPLLPITVPLPKDIAPPPVASRSELSVTSKALFVVTPALLLKKMLRLARISSALPAAPVNAIVFDIVTSSAEPAAPPVA